MQAKIRRCRYSLYISGSGMIIFGVWSTVKSIMAYTLHSSQTESVFEMIEQGEISKTGYLIALCAVLGIDLFLRLYVGLSARAEGLGRKGKKRYLALAVFFMVMQFLFMCLELASLYFIEDSQIVTAVTALVNLTSFIVVTELVVSAFRLRKLEKLQRMQEGAVCS